MSPQFVDFNADGHVDILTATFDGSPHISFGSKEGFGKPEHILDSKGERILISSFWNYKDHQHQETGRALGVETPPKERCISALAFDWDADGDYDLLLGGYEKGHLYRQMNEGTNAEPRFTGKNIAVMAGDAPFGIEAKMTSPRLVDWDGDGDMDIIAGSFGDVWGQGPGGGVFLYRNTGTRGKPVFAAAETLIPVSLKGKALPTRPDAGLYVDAADYDGDGDLDLVVGGYSMWTPEGPELSSAQQDRAKQLAAKKGALQKESLELSRAINREILAVTKGMERGSKELRLKAAEIRATHSKKTRNLSKSIRAVSQELESLVPAPKRKSFVWLYERKQVRPGNDSRN